MIPEFNFSGLPSLNDSDIPQESFDIIQATLGTTTPRTLSPEEVSRSQLEAKKRERAIKNRLSAQQSRERKRRYAEELEEARETLEQETRRLRARVNSLESEKQIMALELGALRGEVQQLKQLLFDTVLRNRIPSTSSSSSSEMVLAPIMEERPASGSISDLSQFWVWRGGVNDSTLNDKITRKPSVRSPSVSQLVDNLLATPKHIPSRLSISQSKPMRRKRQIKSEPTVLRPRSGSVFGLVGMRRDSFPLTKAARKAIRQQRRLTLQARESRLSSSFLL